MSVYKTLGVRRVINAYARLTRLGGSLMPAPVLAAMADAATSYVDMFELQQKVGQRLAELTRNEAAYVCNGAAAGLVLSTLACMTGVEGAQKMGLRAIHSPRREVIVQCAQRIPYDDAVQLAGAELVQIGNAIQTFAWELEAAISERTAAVLYIAGEHLQRAALSLDETVRIAHIHGVPVIVDAAAQLPPPENLWRFTKEYSADLAVFSGGKDLCGPQASGLIVGKAELVAACAAHGSPHRGTGRPMKVGKEEIVGLLRAVELYLCEDQVARVAHSEAVVARWVAAFEVFPGVHARRDFPNEAGQPTPRAVVVFDPQIAGLSAADVERLLWEGDPRICVARADDRILITPDTLEPGDDALITERLVALLSSHTSNSKLT